MDEDSTADVLDDGDKLTELDASIATGASGIGGKVRQMFGCTLGTATG